MSAVVKPKTTGVPFKPEMVRALRAGRKTMTRRLVKPQPPEWIDEFGVFDSTPRGCVTGRGTCATRPRELHIKAPYGGVGDRIYVKEATYRDADGMARYVADGAAVMCEWGPVPWAWKPSTLASMFMPRWAARDYRSIVGLRIERLNEISEADAMAEGVKRLAARYVVPGSVPVAYAELTHRDFFRDLWESINGRGSWDYNELVWVYSLSGTED